MSDGNATVPVLTPTSRQAMTLSAAMRQAAIDMPPMPDGATVSAQITGEGVLVVARVQVRDAHGYVVWEQPYDGRGRRITLGAGVRF